MTTRTKLFWMFFPLLLMLGGVALVITDLKHPQVHRENCQVLGTGRSMASYKTLHNVVMSDGSADVNDIGFRCPQWGVIIINDQEILPRTYPTSAASGRTAEIVLKQFHYLPDHWRVHIPTLNDSEIQ